MTKLRISTSDKLKELLIRAEKNGWTISDDDWKTIFLSRGQTRIFVSVTGKTFRRATIEYKNPVYIGSKKTSGFVVTTMNELEEAITNSPN